MLNVLELLHHVLQTGVHVLVLPAEMLLVLLLEYFLTDSWTDVELAILYNVFREPFDTGFEVFDTIDQFLDLLWLEKVPLGVP